ncbi:Zinc finger RING-CH-type [Arabidopsis thaliana x Arabidopsis arenosa]|uniref:Zinc finger RING-CH-type n=1 Tax=Arabidopsis thaliana x Arabidopsis arenosa TaxID=1240361 RepID=A0A8T1YTJ6_9BRAS|nr:Zinc finger RING-CH-type [Arabidopsis thaliana x Arabidopsis arenosa]
MSSYEISHIDLENGSGERHYRRSDVSGEDSSSCDYDYDFHSAVRSFCGEFEIADDLDDDSVSASESEPSDSMEVSPEKDCRICHLGLESSRHECGDPMVLGCSCKDDLGYVHKQCADTWFKIKGNKTCEICRSIAQNFSKVDNEIDQTTTVETNVDDVEAGNTSTVVATSDSDDRRFWRGNRFLNFLLTCMVCAFVISWFFHFNLPSKQ